MAESIDKKSILVIGGATVDKIHRTLEWKPKCDDLDTIVQTSLDWENRLSARTAKSHAGNV